MIIDDEMFLDDAQATASESIENSESRNTRLENISKLAKELSRNTMSHVLDCFQHFEISTSMCFPTIHTRRRLVFLCEPDLLVDDSRL